jgi:predicted RecA/RadA family phage recombinase
MAANEVIFKQGTPLMVDHTPAGTVLGGQPEVVGDVVLIPHRDLAASKQGALAGGGGIYEVIADAVIAAGVRVYWNASAGKVTETEGANKIFGWSVAAVSGDGVKFLCVHMPSTITGTGGDFLNAVIPTAAQQALSGAGAITITEYYTAWTTTGADAGTLADGVQAGVLKKIQLIVDGGDGTLTPVTLTGGTTITFADAGDYAILQWDGSSWIPIELGNDADGATAPVLA